MGAIYLGKKLGPGGFEKEVVLKQLLPEYTARPEFRDLFFREAKISATLDHANIVHVFDLVQSDESLFIVMEYVRGADLRTISRRARLRRQELSPAASIHIVLEVLAGLGYAHTRKDPKGGALSIIHRDVSPSNVLCSAQGEVKLSDFGIAKAATHSSVFYRVRGKVGYMSPEQARNETIDHRTDLYSLAVCLWEALAGERLFIGDLTTPPDQIYGQPLPPISQKRPGLPAALDVVLAKALAKDVDDRYQSAAEMADALRRVAQRHGLLFSAPELAEHLKKILGADPERWLKEETASTEAPRTQKLPTQSSADLEGKEAQSIGIVDDEGPPDVLSPKPASGHKESSMVPVADDDEEVTRMRNPPMPMKAAPSAGGPPGSGGITPAGRSAMPEPPTPPRSAAPASLPGAPAPLPAPSSDDVATPPPQSRPRFTTLPGSGSVRAVAASAPKPPAIPPPASPRITRPLPPPPPSLGDPPTPMPPLTPPQSAVGTPVVSMKATQSLPRPSRPQVSARSVPVFAAPGEGDDLPPTPPPVAAGSMTASPTSQTLAWPPPSPGAAPLPAPPPTQTFMGQPIPPQFLAQPQPPPPAPTSYASPAAPPPSGSYGSPAGDDFFPNFAGSHQQAPAFEASHGAYGPQSHGHASSDAFGGGSPGAGYGPTSFGGTSNHPAAPTFGSGSAPHLPAFGDPYAPPPFAEQPFVDHGPTPAVMRRRGPPAWLTLVFMLAAAGGGAYLARWLTEPRLAVVLGTASPSPAAPAAATKDSPAEPTQADPSNTEAAPSPSRPAP